MLFYPVRFTEDPHRPVCFCKDRIHTRIHGSNANPIDLNAAGKYRTGSIRLYYTTNFDIQYLNLGTPAGGRCSIPHLEFLDNW